MEHQAYRCCLPTLAGFAGNHCIGPDSQRRPAGCLPTSPPWRGIRPSYSGLLIQGTANSPSSTTKNHGPAPRAVNLKKLEPMAPNTFGTTYSEICPRRFGVAPLPLPKLEPMVGIEPTTLLRKCPHFRSCSTDRAQHLSKIAQRHHDSSLPSSPAPFAEHPASSRTPSNRLR